MQATKDATAQPFEVVAEFMRIPNPSQTSPHESIPGVGSRCEITFYPVQSAIPHPLPPPFAWQTCCSANIAAALQARSRYRQGWAADRAARQPGQSSETGSQNAPAKLARTTPRSSRSSWGHASARAKEATKSQRPVHARD